jgi:phage-related minor tail protein
MENKCACKAEKISVYNLVNEDYQARITPIREKIAKAEKKLEDLRSDYSRDDILKAQMGLIDQKIMEKLARADLKAVATLNDEKDKIEIELKKQQEDRTDSIETTKLEIAKHESDQRPLSKNTLRGSRRD